MDESTVITAETLDATFSRISKRLWGVQALLRWQESAVLYELARIVDTNGVTVELGAHLGGSTVAMALGCQDRGCSALVSVDMWNNDHAGQVNWAETGDLFPTYWRNLRDRGLDGVVVPMRGTTNDVAKRWDSPIRMLFIDADHTYQGVKDDYESWCRFVWPGGIVAFHDYEIEPGVTRLVNEIKSDSDSDLEWAAQVCSIAIFEKKQNAARLYPW
jgi:MMP 1-O-methyltransferase